MATKRHGDILKPEDTSYQDLKTVGRIVISADANGIYIRVTGFEFNNPSGCRVNAAKAIAWARDVLATEAEAIRLVPGGHIKSSVD